MLNPKFQMSKFKVQIKPKIQMFKEHIRIKNFGIPLVFGL